MDRQSKCPHFVCRLIQNLPFPVLDIELNTNIFPVPDALFSNCCQFSTTHSYAVQETIFPPNAAVSISSLFKFLSPNDFVQG